MVRAILQWQCLACGEMCSLKDRWTGSAYEHSHGGQVGHFPAVNLKRRTYAQELARRIAAGPKVEQFASTEI